MAGGRLQPREPWLRLVDTRPSSSDMAGVLEIREGRCVFRRDERCDIHRVLGRAALPSACQHFPRECLLDGRGVSVRLSHYCPTAASLLLAPGAIAIVEGPPAVPDGLMPEGLDARDALPPLLTPELLADLDGYSAWEEHVVSRLAGARTPTGGWLPEQAVAQLARDAERLRRWRPGATTLREHVMSLTGTEPVSSAREPDWPHERHLFDAARVSVPPAWAWAEFPTDAIDRWQALAAPRWPHLADVVTRYLAGHAFASWLPYLGLGLTGVVTEVATALAVLRAECLRACSAAGTDLDAEILSRAIRQTDLLLCHLADRQALARALALLA